MVAPHNSLGSEAKQECEEGPAGEFGHLEPLMLCIVIGAYFPRPYPRPFLF